MSMYYQCVIIESCIAFMVPMKHMFELEMCHIAMIEVCIKYVKIKYVLTCINELS